MPKEETAQKNSNSLTHSFTLCKIADKVVGTRETQRERERDDHRDEPNSQENSATCNTSVCPLARFSQEPPKLLQLLRTLPSSQEKISMGKNLQQPTTQPLPNSFLQLDHAKPRTFPRNPRNCGKTQPRRRGNSDRSPQQDAIQLLILSPSTENYSLAPTNSSHSKTHRSCGTQHQNSRSFYSQNGR